MKYISILLLVISLCIAGKTSAQENIAEKKWESYIDLNKYLEPFWKADTIYDETILPLKEGNGLAEAKLLFKAKKIIAVKDGNLNKEFIRGTDWIYKNGKIILPAGSTAPYFDKNELIFNKEKPGWCQQGVKPGTFVLFHEGFYFPSKQLKITYLRERNDKWKGPVPASAKSLLPKTISKLLKKDTLKIVDYGDSITEGANASGMESINVPPFMPKWANLITYDLQAHYHSPVNSVNLGVGGKDSKYGVENVIAKVLPQKPDLTIIAFGMNDGTSKVEPEQFRKNIKYIIDNIRKDNPDAEFILVCPMLANPTTVFSGNQELYKAVLNSLTGKGIVIADMTGVHKELLKHKSYQDMTGNNINHPNDYLIRWYAQFISGLLIQ